MDRLYYSDQIRCRAVCKSWRSNINGVKYADILPWVFAHGRCPERCGEMVYYLYEPSHKRKYVIDTRNVLDRANVLASNYGWMLFYKDVDFTRTTSLFFYNPFTDKIIKLPPLSIEGFVHATFSANPTFPECVIFVVDQFHSPNKICISTCSPGDTTWTFHQPDIGFDGFVLSVAYIDGVLYCVFRHQTSLFAFKTATNECRIYSHDLILQLDAVCLSKKLIESDGNLLMVIYDCAKSHWRIFRFDLSQMKWFEAENLGNKLLFIGKNCLVVPAVGEASELANTIYTFDSWCYTRFLKATNDHFVPRTYSWTQGSLWLRNTWILPPQSR